MRHRSSGEFDVLGELLDGVVELVIDLCISIISHAF